MKKKHFFYFVLICFFIRCSSHPAKSLFTLDQAILQEDLPELVIACGIVATANALLFKSSNNDSYIVGIIQCVNLYDSTFFKKGLKYSLQVTQNNLTECLKNDII